MNPPPVVSVLVPCYNEQDAIAETLDKLDAALAPLGDYEIIVINDGSLDGTLARARELAPRYPRVRIVEHDRNRGYGAALKTGMRHARADYIAIIDADGTYPIADLPRLVHQARDEDLDMVVGARTGSNVQYPLIRKIPKYFLRAWINWIVKTRVPDINSGMRVFRKSMAQRFVRILPDGFSFTITITITISSIRNNYRVVFEPINYFERQGKSKIRPIHDTLRFLQIIGRTGMYFAPIRILAPVIALLLASAAASVVFDIYHGKNLTDKTVILFTAFLNVSVFALLADMIDKRTGNP